MSAKGISTEDIEAQLKLRDRLNYTYLLSQQIFTYQKAVLNMDLSEDEVGEAIEGLINMIPEAWRDKEFEDDIKGALQKTNVDVRPSYCGIKASVKFCIDNGIAVTVESEERDYHALFKACVDLFQRRGMLSKRTYIEIMLGTGYKSEEPDLAEAVIENAET